MRRLLLASCLAVATLSGCAGVSINESAGIERVLAAPSRSAADRERDARDKPAEVLALAKFKRGDTVADILAGGGYYSEILSGIVGPIAGGFFYDWTGTYLAALAIAGGTVLLGLRATRPLARTAA